MHKNNITSVDFQQNIRNLNLIMKKQQTNQTKGLLPKWLSLGLQNQMQSVTEEVFQVKGDLRNMTTGYNVRSKVFFFYGRHHWDNWQNQDLIYTLGNSTVVILISWLWGVAATVIQRVPVLLKTHTEVFRGKKNYQVQLTLRWFGKKHYVCLCVYYHYTCTKRKSETQERMKQMCTFYYLEESAEE